MIGYIYITTNLINNKKYIGMHKKSYFDPNYKGSGKILKQAFTKYGWDNFKVEILKECDTLEDLYDSEVYYIDKFDATNSHDFYNIKQGGNGGYHINGVSIKKGVKITEQARLNISIAHKGKTLTPDHCKAISESLKGDRNPLRREGSEVARKKLSESMKGNQNGVGFFVTNGTVNHLIKSPDDIPEGFRLGRANPGFLRYKYNWMTKDQTNIKVRVENIDEYLSKGFVIGRYIKSRRATTIESISSEKSTTE